MALQDVHFERISGIDDLKHVMTGKVKQRGTAQYMIHTIDPILHKPHEWWQWHSVRGAAVLIAQVIDSCSGRRCRHMLQSEITSMWRQASDSALSNFAFN